MPNLTRFEQAILSRLQQDEGQIVSKEDILQSLYSPIDVPPPQSNGIEVFVSRLRKKLGDDRIETVRGRGYILVPVAPTSEVVAVENAG